MSINFENFESTVTGELDKAVAVKPVTGFMADNNLRARLVGGRTVLIPEMADPSSSTARIRTRPALPILPGR